MPLVLTALVWRFGRWAALAATVLMALALLSLAPGIPFGLGHPNSFFDFGPMIVGSVGALLAIGSSVAVCVQRRRDSVRAAATPGERRAIVAGALALVAVAAVSGVLTLAGRSTVSAQAKSGATAMKMKASKFAPLRVEAKAGQPLRVVVDNTAPALHTFTIRQIGVGVTVNPDSEQVIDLGTPAAGTYTYVCTLHDQMKGTLVVQ